MFARKFRLPAQTTFLHAQHVSALFFTVKIVSNTLSYNRYGFVVSKKIDKRATVRNKLKRQLRACVEEIHQTLSQGHDLLFIIKPESKKQTSGEIKEQLHVIMQKIKHIQ